ncbi:hypothetical protein KOR42_10700 [Thalassoglobus neptunius]|uniref:Uncharacterized protein n=1 Tax=Thalassoglobus neptunius TaxID=1938619 RepID=A0A5C5X406_9PLAN|nr:hypothetical protein [Thalassoglobus neptunius]TWT57706.1 hypothetical protein KOR42_10700 [Thalassoglobus neptunius]
MSHPEPTQMWPIDAVMIVAAGPLVARHDPGEAITRGHCRDCGDEVVIACSTIALAQEEAEKLHRPVKYFCCRCALNYDSRTINKLVDRRRKATR